MAHDADAILRVLRQDIAKPGDFLYRRRPDHRAIRGEQQRRFEVHQDAVFGALGLCDLLQLLRLLVQVIADRSTGDAAHQSANCRALPAASERTYARADRRTGTPANRSILAGRSATGDRCNQEQRKK